MRARANHHAAAGEELGGPGERERSGVDGGRQSQLVHLQAAIGAQVANGSERNTIDVVGFLFDYVVRDVAIPPRVRLIFDGLQVPILKVALADSSQQRRVTRAAVHDLTVVPTAQK